MFQVSVEVNDVYPKASVRSFYPALFHRSPSLVRHQPPFQPMYWTPEVTFYFCVPGNKFFPPFYEVRRKTLKGYLSVLQNFKIELQRERVVSLWISPCVWDCSRSPGWDIDPSTLYTGWDSKKCRCGSWGDSYLPQSSVTVSDPSVDDSWSGPFRSFGVSFWYTHIVTRFQDPVRHKGVVCSEMSSLSFPLNNFNNPLVGRS